MMKARYLILIIVVIALLALLAVGKLICNDLLSSTN